MGTNSLTWTWNPGGRDVRIYSILCKVTDAKDHIEEVVWKDFAVSPMSQTNAEKDSSHYSLRKLRCFCKQAAPTIDVTLYEF
jgi:hypothetical protein